MVDWCVRVKEKKTLISCVLCNIDNYLSYICEPTHLYQLNVDYAVGLQIHQTVTSVFGRVACKYKRVLLLELGHFTFFVN